MVRDTLFTHVRRLFALCVLCTAILPIATASPLPAKGKKAAPSTIQVSDLRTERMTRPMSISTPTPRLGWVLSSTLNDVKQTAYHIIVDLRFLLLLLMPHL